ncbi:hypothetical protein LP420_06965 [Massilia sp. B-10]|nr:hypothetical protein LP420_06965 [Massilia sp. B-10]
MQAAVSSGTPASLALVGQRTGLAWLYWRLAHRRQAAVRCLPCCHRLPIGMLVAERPKPPFGALLLLLA